MDYIECVDLYDELLQDDLLLDNIDEDDYEDTYDLSYRFFHYGSWEDLCEMVNNELTYKYI